jgi:hypothetical protein
MAAGTDVVMDMAVDTDMAVDMGMVAVTDTQVRAATLAALMAAVTPAAGMRAGAIPGAILVDTRAPVDTLIPVDTGTPEALAGMPVADPVDTVAAAGVNSPSSIRKRTNGLRGFRPGSPFCLGRSL